MDDRLDRIEARLKELGQEIRTVRKRITDIRRGLARIEREGWTDWRIKYRDKARRYMVLVKHGEQPQKRYIGVDPQKQEEARAQVQRYEQREALRAELVDIEARVRSLESRLGFGAFPW